ncbi:unnamed protein product [Onchocerca flexuosa]|uniref:SAWADEE domain-containing protein n=1 Tax=Onchocerca flexuosa TaxID=387005 RepID=A0A183HWV1_9BILA|nr:unnamed protein product [Onchocerca flexuosa]
MEQEFINIGWFVATEYTDPELQEEPPASPIIEKLQRRVCTDDVRVTTFAIKWRRNEENVIDSGDSGDIDSSEDIEINETIKRNGDDFAIKDDIDADKNDDLEQSLEANRNVDVKIEDELEIEASLEGKSTITGLPLLDVTNESIPDLVD